MQKMHKLKRFYTGADEDFGHLARSARHMEPEEFPVYIREKGSKSKGIECRDALELESEANLFFDDYPKKMLEIIRPMHQK